MTPGVTVAVEAETEMRRKKTMKDGIVPVNP